MSFQVGDTVTVRVPNAKIEGKVVAVLPNFGLLNPETKYEIHGTKSELVTITSARQIRSKS